jgi:OmpA-OmpF porin, OOP family
MRKLVLGFPAMLMLLNPIQKATVPTADKKGSKDSALLKRYESSFIVAYEQKAFAEFTLPLSKLDPVPDRKDSMNNRLHEPKSKKALEGPYTRLVYLLPAGRSPLEVLRNYQEEIKGKGGKILFECKAEECGGDATRSSSGGGGDMSLAMYLYPKSRITEEYSNTGYCAMVESIKDQRYTAASLPESAHVSVLTYSIVSTDAHDGCSVINDRTVAIVEILESKAREQKMVTVSSGEMAQAISSGGRVALYGIYFDFNKADVKAESDPTLEQMAKLLKESPSLKLLVVGHTDNVGSFSSNMDLSQRRAAAVVSVLTTRFGVTRSRLTPLGVSYASPVASNNAEEGRAKNRRVELVENSPASR